MTDKKTPPHFSTVSDNDILWIPSKENVQQANSTRFISHINQLFDVQLQTFADLYQWSIENPERFWNQLWDHTELIGDKGEHVLENKNQMPGAVWFSDSKLNFAENLLNEKNRNSDEDGEAAIVFWGEDQQKRHLNFADLKQQVASLSQHLRDNDIKAGDVVAGFMPNIPEAVIAMLATSSIGAVWTSCSPDFGTQGVLALTLILKYYPIMRECLSVSYMAQAVPYCNT